MDSLSLLLGFLGFLGFLGLFGLLGFLEFLELTEFSEQPLPLCVDSELAGLSSEPLLSLPLGCPLTILSTMLESSSVAKRKVRMLTSMFFSLDLLHKLVQL